MGTLYIRGVDSAAIDVLKARAAAAGMSLSAYVGGELAKLAARPTNAELAERLWSQSRPDGLTTDEIVEAVRASRR
ncbi:antitoxin [Gryllotalpicola protaetiae]|uniref:Antitoxin n=1 Tax=Gryllotalpicola protaetiae TaxID=2419771 RepID=A0A387BPF6_9MICO|nr:antitoxin [Gryllotalpicola protaetiae]AYG02890.1 antitoxin [Gryllotalpicola protaetiae]